jgi:hypothetical protein
MENDHNYTPGRSLINELACLHDQVMDLVEEQRKLEAVLAAITNRE